MPQENNRITNTSTADHIFVSYARVDWDGYVERWINELESVGLSVWVDQKLIRGGDDWLDQINHALQICDRMIVCISPEALRSRFVKMEYRYFFIREKPLYPLICRPTELPAELELYQYTLFSDRAKLLKQLA